MKLLRFVVLPLLAAINWRLLFWLLLPLAIMLHPVWQYGDAALQQIPLALSFKEKLSYDSVYVILAVATAIAYSLCLLTIALKYLFYWNLHPMKWPLYFGLWHFVVMLQCFITFRMVLGVSSPALVYAIPFSMMGAISLGFIYLILVVIIDFFLGVLFRTEPLIDWRTP